MFVKNTSRVEIANVRNNMLLCVMTQLYKQEQLQDSRVPFLNSWPKHKINSLLHSVLVVSREAAELVKAERWIGRA